jgi:hypothetical protein
VFDQSVIDGLVQNPSENLNVELKRWINPTETLGEEKIAKAALSLRNRNGGYLVIGFDNDSLTPDDDHEPADARDLFHLDAIQGIVSRYASDPFQIEVAWGRRDHKEYPVIVIPPGFKTPVAAKRDLLDGTRSAVKFGVVYCRSLNSNGVPSTTEAKPTDWADIIEMCFDNREADVGRFIRRHLAGLDLTSLSEYTRYLPQQIPATLCDRAKKAVDQGEVRCSNAIKERALSSDEKTLLGYGFWSIGLVVEPQRNDAVPNREFLSKIFSSNPNYTGWPVWLDSRHNLNVNDHPKVISGVYEYLIVSTVRDFSSHIDFARFDPKGEFFLTRLLQDDGAPKVVEPGKVIDPILMILRVAEAMAVGIAFAKTLEWKPEETTLGFAFRWDNLKERRLTPWANQHLRIPGGGTAHDDSIESCVQFSLDTPLSALAQYVDQATKHLFAAFDGSAIPINVTEGLVRQLFDRKLI